MKIHESAENYLETILLLQQRKGSVRSIDIANELEFSKPSVSVAMKNLRQGGYIEVDAAGQIHLLPPGLAIAEAVLEGDADHAREAMQAHLTAAGELMEGYTRGSKR